MLTILNDVHAGVIRSAGTTPASQWQLRKEVISEFNRLLPTEGDLMILGDLFDTHNVPVYDVLQMFTVLADWLAKHPSASLYNVAGNHDLSKTSTVLSSFQFLGSLLTRHFSGQYVHIEQPVMTPYGYVVPHLRNQDVFDMALAEVPKSEFLFLHCNYDNNFAAQSDQSLNLTREQAEALPVAQIILAHEHHQRNSGKVSVIGNQIATSVSDWLAPVNKWCGNITDDGFFLTLAATRSEQFVEMDLTQLELTDHKFVKVTGTVDADKLSAALTTVNKFRAASPALVVTNSVSVKSEDGSTEVFSDALESVKKFSILEALKKHLTAEEYKIVEPFTC